MKYRPDLVPGKERFPYDKICRIRRNLFREEVSRSDGHRNGGTFSGEAETRVGTGH